MPEPCFSAAVIAKICGLSERQIHNLVKDKVIPGAQSRGNWPITNVTSYIEHLRRVRDSGGEDAHEQKTRLLKEQADKIEMENAARRGELLDRSDVDAAMVSAFARVRSRLLAIPSKAAPIVTQHEDPAEAEIVLRGYVSDALRELSETDVSTLGETDSDVVEGSDAASRSDGKPVGGRGKAA